MDEQRTCNREHIRDIMSRIMDVETELQLQSVRKPAIEHQTEPLDCCAIKTINEFSMNAANNSKLFIYEFSHKAKMTHVL